MAICLAVCLHVGGALAQPLATDTKALIVEGEVEAVRSRWAADRSAILSEVSVRRPDGTVAVMHQLGGTVDGIGMLLSHHPAPLEVGQRVRARAALTSKGTYMLRALEAPEPVSSEAVAKFGPRPDSHLVARYGVNRTKRSQTPLYWASGCIYLSYDSVGTEDLPGGEEFRIMDEAAAEWENETNVCSGLTFSSSFIDAPEAGRNFINTVQWREDRWCRPASGDIPEICHSPDAIAVTQIFFIDNPESLRDGEIVEADIEINGVNFAFTEDGETLGLAPRSADLRSTMTHELGHVLGLTHNCWLDFEEPQYDHQGSPTPNCTQVAPDSETVEATMYYVQQEGEVKKATLETSDVLGGCATLSGAQCDRVVRSGCAVAPGRARSRWPALALVLLALALLAARARRRRRG